jgi:exodeoxyribonuclease VII large subunit
VPVQGEGAAPAIAAAIRGFNAMAEAERPDLLIVARGGGSVEDLMAFNAEEVVRAAAGSTIPLIAAVGHETDTTLIDHAADVRAPTPTAAAELAVPVGADLRETLADLGLRAERSERRARIRAADKFADLAARLPRPSALLGPSRQRFDDCCDRFGRGLRNLVAGDRARLAAASARLQARLLVQRVERERARAQAPRVTPNPALLAGRIRAARAALAGTMRLIESLAPQSDLERGFALVEDGRGGLVKRAAGVATGDRLVLRFADGTRPVVAAGGPRSRPPAAPDQGTLL